MIELKNNPAGNFFLLAGPCVIEGEEMAMRIAERVVGVTEKLQIPYVFKGSYRKANRSRLDSFTGIGDEKALKVLKKAAEDDRFDELKNKFEQVEAELKDDTQTNLETYRKQVVEAIINDIVMRYGYQAGVIEHSLPGDKEVKQAIGVLENPEEYARITREQDTQRK